MNKPGIPQKASMMQRAFCAVFGVGALVSLFVPSATHNLWMYLGGLFAGGLFLIVAIGGRPPRIFWNVFGQGLETNAASVGQGHLPSLTLQGGQGKTVVVEGATVKVTKMGGIFATQRDKTIPIRSITSVEVKKPGPLVVGFIQFSIAGGAARDSSYTYTGGAFDAVQDENSVVFADMVSYECALRIKTYIENYHDAPVVSSQQHLATIADDPIAKLERLAALRQRGVLSEEEFVREKAKALGHQPATRVPSQSTAPSPSEQRVAPCPLCQSDINLTSLRVGNNQCPHCRGTFVAE